MEKIKINYFVDCLMAITFLIVAVSRIVILFFLPTAGPRAGFYEFLGFARRTWTSIHNFCGLLFSALVMAHLFLHWRWFVETTKRFLKIS